MHIVVFGANGRVGTIVVKLALEKGHQVRAFVHGSAPFSAHANLSIVQGDIYNSSSINEAILGTDAVISTLGSWGTPNKNILSEGMKHIIPAMQSHGIRRIVSLTGSAARASEENLNLLQKLNRLTLGFVAPKILKDGELHISLLERSDLDYTIIRSPVMNTKGSTNYKLSTETPLPWATIHQNAVAQAILDTLEQYNPDVKAPFITRR